MTIHEPASDREFDGKSGDGQTIDLQGVAAFAGLVELLAQELGAKVGRMQGLLPSGPAQFDELAGEIPICSQGYNRKVTLFSRPGDVLKMHFQTCFGQANSADIESDWKGAIESTFYFNATVEAIGPQGRALARHVEDVFKVMDAMVTLGKSGKMAGMSVATSDIESFERTLDGSLVQESNKEKQEAFEPSDIGLSS